MRDISVLPRHLISVESQHILLKPPYMFPIKPCSPLSGLIISGVLVCQPIRGKRLLGSTPMRGLRKLEANESSFSGELYMIGRFLAVPYRRTKMTDRLQLPLDAPDRFKIHNIGLC